MFKINEDLKHRIINKIPADYTPLQKCVFVYGYMCSILEYSTDYYANEELFAPRFQNPKNLEKVDGTSYNQVVCYTFCAIYQSIIESLNLPKVKIVHSVEMDEDGNFEDYHDSIELLIDGVVYNVDATTGVLMNNDLVDQKFENRKIKHFTVLKTGNLPRDSKKAELQQVIDTVYEDLKLTKLSDQYVRQKADEYKKLPLQNRFNLFKKLLQYTPDYSISALNYIQVLKHSLFDRLEYAVPLRRERTKKQYFQLSFVREGTTGEVKSLIFFNPNGYSKEEPNFETLQIYEFSAKSKYLRDTNRNNIYESIVDKRFYDIDGYGNDIVCLDSELINMAIDDSLL